MLFFRKASRAVSLMLALTLVTACGSTGTSSETTVADETTSAEVTTAPSNEYEKPDVDYGGEIITISSYDYSDGYVLQNYKIDLDEDNGDMINDAIVKRNRQVEEELNVDIQIYPLVKNDRYNTAILDKQIMAGDSEIDFALHMYGGLASIVASEGMLVELNSIPTLDLSHSWWNQNANEEYTLYGKQFVALGEIGLFNLGSPLVMYFSKKLVEDNHLDNPYQLVYDGKWTVDNFIKMATDVSKDLNGNQTVEDSDQFGFCGQVGGLWWFCQAAGVRIAERDKSGNISIGVNNEISVALTEKLVPFLNEASVVRVEETTASKFPTSLYTEYFIPKIMADEALFFQNALHVALNLRQMEGDFGILPVPKYDEEQENYVGSFVSAFSDHLIIPVTTTELDMIGNVIEAMGFYGQQYITPAFIDTTVMGKSVRDDDSANMIQIVRDNMTFDIGTLFNWGGVSSIYSDLVKSNSTSFSSTYASKESAIQAALEKTVENLNK